VEWEAILAYATGLGWLAPGMPFDVLWRTALLVHLCDAVVCAILARGSGRSARLWLGLGFLGGIWALATLLVLPVNPRR